MSDYVYHKYDLYSKRMGLNKLNKFVLRYFLRVRGYEQSVMNWDKPFHAGLYQCSMLLQVFSGVFADDPMFVCQVMQQAIELIDQQGSRKTGKERQVATLNYCGHVLDVVTSRHRLIDAAWETEILTKVAI